MREVDGEANGKVKLSIKLLSYYHFLNPEGFFLA